MLLSVIISNRNDNAMLAVTVRSVLEELKPVNDRSEIVIVDNSDKDIFAGIQKGSFIAPQYMREKRVKLLRQDFPCLFAAREMAVSAASGEYILCLDGHMLVGHRMLADMVAFMQRRKDDPKLGFAHAPISWCHQHEGHAKHDRDMATSELGDWGRWYREERKITWKGMPWICRKSFWQEIGGYGTLATEQVSWGGGDMYLGVKPWLLGFENWAVPCSPGIRIGPFPKEANATHKYRLYKESGKYPSTFGFLVACYILGGESMLSRNADIVRKRFGWRNNFDEHVELAKRIGAREKAALEARRIMSFEELLAKQP